jgi:hypothetical protein
MSAPTQKFDLYTAGKQGETGQKVALGSGEHRCVLIQDAMQAAGLGIALLGVVEGELGGRAVEVP